MLLRRVIEHVKAQNWFAVGLDFAIVVTGVFIGIQVANWNADRADIRRGEIYVQRLVDDLTIDLNRRRLGVDYYDEVNESGEHTIELLAHPSSDDKELVVRAYRSTEYNYDPHTRSTWDEIVSSGDLGLLPNRTVLDGLSLYFGAESANLMALEELRNSQYRARVRRTIPHRVQKAIRSGCSDMRDGDGNVIGFSRTCRLDVSDEDITAAANALRNDPELPSDLRYNFSYLSSSRLNMRGDIVILERVIGALSGEIYVSEAEAES